MQNKEENFHGWHGKDIKKETITEDAPVGIYIESTELWYGDESLGELNDFTDLEFCRFLNEHNYPYSPDNVSKVKNFMQRFYTDKALIRRDYERKKYQLIKELDEEQNEKINTLGNGLMSELNYEK